MMDQKGGPRGRGEADGLYEEPWRPGKPMGLARSIAKAGHGTRARAAEMVRSGRVKVDDRVVTDPSFRIGPENVLLLDEQPFVAAVRRYYAFHKPLKVVTTAGDPGGSRLVAEFFPSEVPGLIPAGRLDGNTSGLMLVSNDAAWNGLAAGCAALEKEYRVQVKGRVGEMELGIIRAGIHLPNLGVIRPRDISIQETRPEHTILNLVVIEGRNRQIRRIFSTLRHDVVWLRRTRIGPVRLGNLPVGKLRSLTRDEIQGIRDAARQEGPPED